MRWQSKPNPRVILARYKSSRNRGRGCSSSCSRRRALPNGRGWRGRAQLRPKNVSSMGPGHAWVREETERV